MDEETKKLAIQIKKLSDNVETLTKVTAITIGKEEIFKGKKEKNEKIQVLTGYDLSDNIIALIVGSSPDSVRSLRHQAKGVTKTKNESSKVLMKDGQDAV